MSRSHAAGEAALVARAQAGDEQAFAALYEHELDALVGYCLKRIGAYPGAPEDARDLAQDVLLKAWLHLGDLGDLGDTARGPRWRGWLYRIAANACTDLLRHRAVRRVERLENYQYRLDAIGAIPLYFGRSYGARRPQGLAGVDTDPREQPEAAALAPEGAAEVRAVLDAVAAASPGLAAGVAALGWRYREGLGHGEIGARSGRSASAIKSLLWRTRRAVRDELRRRERHQ